MNTCQVGVLRIMIIMMTHVHVDVELHGHSHVTFYNTFVLFCWPFVLIAFIVTLLDLGLRYIMMLLLIYCST